MASPDATSEFVDHVDIDDLDVPDDPAAPRVLGVIVVEKSDQYSSSFLLI